MKCFKFCKNKLMLAALALLMSFSVSLEAYAADSVSLDEVKVILSSSFLGVNFSDYYYKSVSSDLSYRIMLIRQDIFDKYTDIVAYQHTYTDGNYQYRLGGFNGSEIVHISDNYGNGVSFNASGVSSGTVSANSFLYSTQYPCDFSTNIPLFDSMDSARNYVLSGDTSGLLNPDNVPKTYSKDVETPKDLRVDMDADFRAQMGYAPGNGDEDVDASNSYCKFTWSQSDEVVEAGNYVTEIYYQTSFVHHSNPLCIGNKTFSLSSSKLVAAVPVDKVNMSYTMDFSRIEEIYQEWFDAGLIGGTMKPTYPTEPYYFYVRNVCGNTYGNWVRVTVNNDNVSVSNSITGANTVTGGYTEIDGSTATLPDINQKLDGDVVNDSQYGVNYRVDIDAESFNTIVNNFKSGFGLLGDNGALALISSCFSFLPEQYFTILVTFVAAASMVGLFLLFLGR